MELAARKYLAEGQEDDWDDIDFNAFAKELAKDSKDDIDKDYRDCIIKIAVHYLFLARCNARSVLRRPGRWASRNMSNAIRSSI